ncbi:MAG: hypothetical protein AVDCRST_MAG41-367, partial [uncultured Corynebacteriales bacterium]
MTSGSFRADIAADPRIGIGSVLADLVARGEALDEPAIAFDSAVDGHPAGHPLSLRELDRAVAARSAALAAAVAPRDPVALHVSTAADQLLGYLALARLGAIPALLNRNLAAPVAAEYAA